MKKLLFILLILPLSIFFSCGKSSRFESYSSNQEKQPIAYYVVTDVITPDGHTLSYSGEVNNIYNQNNNYNLVMIEFSGSLKAFISCTSSDCLFLSKENLTAIEVDSFGKLLNKLNYPDKITNVADEIGFRYNAFKLSESTDINKFKKVMFKNNIS